LNSKKKYRVWYPNQLFTRTTHEQAIKLLNKKPLVPWLWIGSSEDEEVSSRLDEFMVVGNIITLELLNDLFPYDGKIRYFEVKKQFNWQGTDYFKGQRLEITKSHPIYGGVITLVKDEILEEITK
jgi:hypothetical protein